MGRFTIAAGSILLVCAGGASAQETGSLEGVLSTPEGAGIRGATVLVLGADQAEVSDVAGRFRFAAVPAGTYEISITLGNQSTLVPGVVVEADATTRLDRELPWELRFLDSITVFSASRREERIVDAPAAVTVVSEEQIESNAAHGQLTKLLEYTPGAEITQSGLYDHNLNTRGFNSSLNRRVATLIDGRNPSVPFLGSQEWAGVSFPLDDLASAEFVRGPSAALYGANAASGVLNLVTKAPALSEGGTLRLTGGEMSTLNADLRWAGGLGGKWYGKVVGGLRNSGDYAVSRVGTAEYTVPCPPGVNGNCLPQEVVPLNPLDDVEVWFAGARADYDFAEGYLATLEGGTASISGPVFQTGIGRVQVVDAERPWMRLAVSGPSWSAFAASSRREAPEQTALASGTNLALDDERRQLELQKHWSLAGDRGRLVLGASYQEEDIDSEDPRTGNQTLMFRSVETDSQAVFGQFDWTLGERWKLVLAGRWDDASLYDSRFSPKGGLVYSLSEDHSLRLTYNEAFQVANYSEYFLAAPAAPPSASLAPLEGLFCAPFGVDCGFAPLVPVMAVGNEDLELEEVRTIELGWSGILADRTFLTLDYYRSENENFITDLVPQQLGVIFGRERINPNFGPYVPPAGLPEPVRQQLLATLMAVMGPQFLLLSNAPNGAPILVGASYTNFGDVDTQGVDFGLNHYFDGGWSVNFTYSWFDFEIARSAPGLESLLLPNSPEHKIAAGLGYRAGNWDVAVNGRWVDGFTWAVGPFQGDVASYTVLDMVANWQVHEHVGLGLNIANLFDEEHWESFGGDVMGRRALASVTLGW